MKVLDVTEFYSERGGGVRSHLTLKGHVLCQLGHQHVVVAPGASDSDTPASGDGGAGAGGAGETKGGARVIRVRGPASPYDPSYHLLLDTGKVRDLIARERPDVLEIHSPYMAAAAALRARPGSFGVRTFQWHSDFIDTYGGVLADKVRFLPRAIVQGVTEPLWSLVRGIARRCSATLVASAWQVGKLAAHGVPNVVHRPFGIERSIFRPEAASDEARRALLRLAGRTEDTTVLVGLGRFAIEKRWDLVLDAFARLQTDAILVLFGDGPERDRMKARAGANVVFPGFATDRAGLAASLASADALVHGCPFETFGLSIAEAMSCGLPAVVPDDGGASEMHDPGSGERYTANDVDACAQAIERLLGRIATGRDAMRASAVRAAGRLPSVTRQFQEQVAFYSELLGQ